MLRYLRLYSHLIRFSLSSATLFRFDFYFRILMDTLYYISSIVLFKVFFLNSPTFGGWTEPQALIFVGAFMFVDAMQMTFLASNYFNFHLDINRGRFDFALVRPVSTMFMSLCFHISVASFVNLLMATGFLGWALYSYPGSIPTGRLLIFLLLLLNGVLLHSLIRLFFMVSIFWTHSGRGTEQVFFSLTELMERPDTVYRPWLGLITRTILPFALIASVPTRLLFNGATLFDAATLSALLSITTITVMLVCIARFLWFRGLRAYASASS